MKLNVLNTEYSLRVSGHELETIKDALQCYIDNGFRCQITAECLINEIQALIEPINIEILK